MRGTLRVVVMGVAGCGKSEVGARLAALLDAPLIEGDQFHSAHNVAKMREGLALTDADRAGWLSELGALLATHHTAVLTCSALKKQYRDTLRSAVPDVRFLFLWIDEPTAQARVAGRSGHFYPASLVSSQFDVLENPGREPGVITLDAELPPHTLAQVAAAWLKQGVAHAS